jgi:phosphopantothenoylcysteine decarboxylase/phosphopantothenate--cysteine ligase
VARTYDEYRSAVHEEAPGCVAGVFSAGVADYRPDQAVHGKIPSGRASLTLNLVPTAKVIDEVRAAHPGLYMVTFKYQEGLTLEELLGIAGARLDRFDAVVANRGEEQTATTQRAWLLTRDGEPRPFDGKRAIAAAIADLLERALP